MFLCSKSVVAAIVIADVATVATVVVVVEDPILNE